MQKKAGRPAKDGAQYVTRYNVTLDDDTWLFFKRYGHGNLSQGIRMAKSAIEIAEIRRKLV